MKEVTLEQLNAYLQPYKDDFLAGKVDNHKLEYHIKFYEVVNGDLPHIYRHTLVAPANIYYYLFKDDVGTKNKEFETVADVIALIRNDKIEKLLK